MSKLNLKEIRRWPADKLSGRLLVVMIVLSAVIFGVFWFIGYDTPFVDDASFNAPLFTDVLLVYMYLLLAVAIVACGVSVAHGLKRRDASEAVTNGVPASRIARGSVALLVCSLLLTFVFGSSEPLKVNGVDFIDTFWLKATDMFIYTSVILIVVALGAVAYGLSGYNRREHPKKGGR